MSKYRDINVSYIVYTKTPDELVDRKDLSFKMYEGNDTKIIKYVDDKLTEWLLKIWVACLNGSAEGNTLQTLKEECINRVRESNYDAIWKYETEWHCLKIIVTEYHSPKIEKQRIGDNVRTLLMKKILTL